MNVSWSMLSEPGRITVGKSHMTVRSTQGLRPPRVSHVSLHTNSGIVSKLPFKSSSQFIAPTSSTPGRNISAVILWIHLSLLITGRQLVLKSFFFSGSKSRHWFSVCSAFFLAVRMWVTCKNDIYTLYIINETKNGVLFSTFWFIYSLLKCKCVF